MLSSPKLDSRSMSPRRIPDMKKKQLSLDSNVPSITSTTNNNGIIPMSPQFDQMNLVSETKIELNNAGSSSSNDANNIENISDNGSEISDEGYRSLGLIQANNQNNNAQNKRASLHSQTSTEDAELNGMYCRCF